jgi:molybdopterin molybdotransferase
VKEVLSELGVVTDFWRVKVKPGKPFVFGRHEDGTLVFGLPGNTVSAFVTFTLFVKPVIARLLGFSVEEGQQQVSAVAAEEMNNKGDRPHYLRGNLNGKDVCLSGTQQSHAIFGLSKSNCLVRLEPGQKIEAGQELTVLPV